MKKEKVLACLMLLSLLPFVSVAKTVAYWQLDNDEDNLDAVNDDYLYYDLHMVGDVADGVANPNANPVPNPSKAHWRVGDPCLNSSSQYFNDYDGDDGWWRDPQLGVGDTVFTYIESNYDDQNPQTFDVNGTCDSAFQFDHNKSFTVEFFVHPTYNGYICGNRSSFSYPYPYKGWQLWITGGGTIIRFWLEGDPNERVEGEPINSVELTYQGAGIKNNWNHIAAVWDHDADPNGMLYLYVNGNLKDSAEGHPTWSGVVGGPWLLGVRKIFRFPDFPEYGHIWDYGMRGYIDEFRFVDEALTPEYFLNGATPYVLCGEGVNILGDINTDCKVDMFDLHKLIDDWLKCTDPQGVGCVQL